MTAENTSIPFWYFEVSSKPVPIFNNSSSDFNFMRHLCFSIWISFPSDVLPEWQPGQLANTQLLAFEQSAKGRLQHFQN